MFSVVPSEMKLPKHDVSTNKIFFNDMTRCSKPKMTYFKHDHLPINQYVQRYTTKPLGSSKRKCLRGKTKGTTVSPQQQARKVQMFHLIRGDVI